MQFLASEFRQPLGLNVGWVEVESGGDVHNSTDILGGEYGLYQISADERAVIGANPDLLQTDESYSLYMGNRLADHYAGVVRSWRLPIRDGSEYFWRLVKACHTFGSESLHQALLGAFAADQGSTWEDFEAWARENPDTFGKTVQLSPAQALYHLGNIDRVFAIGAPYGLTTLTEHSALFLLGTSAIAATAVVLGVRLWRRHRRIRALRETARLRGRPSRLLPV